MLMGDVLASARRSAGGFERWLRDEDPDLAARLAAAAAAEGESPAAWLRMAIADFDRFASEEDWATLVSHMRDDADPGSRFLLAVLEWRLAAAGSQPAFRSSSEEPDHERDTEATRT